MCRNPGGRHRKEGHASVNWSVPIAKMPTTSHSTIVGTYQWDSVNDDAVAPCLAVKPCSAGGGRETRLPQGPGQVRPPSSERNNSVARVTSVMVRPPAVTATANG